MNGSIALVGSGEYLPVMEEVDLVLLAGLNLNGRKPRVVCLPTAAGREGDESVNRWSNMGISHFEKLGAEVKAVRIIDRKSADDPQWESLIEAADLIYFSGGDPNYLHKTLEGSRAWNAARKAWSNGAVYAGCSAGAMILANRIPSFRLFSTNDGFGIVQAKFILPHFDAVPAMFRPVVTYLKSQLKNGEIMIGIDEDTALIGKLNETWKVLGKGKVHLFRHDAENVYETNQTLSLN
jgi:cyanophycinase